MSAEEEGAADTKKRRKRVKQEEEESSLSRLIKTGRADFNIFTGKRISTPTNIEEKDEEPVVVVLKDPYWVGQDVRGPQRGYKIRKEILDKGHKYVILYLDGFDYITHRISLGCRLINGEFLGWNQTEEYPVTLRQVGREAVLSLHKSEGTKEIRLTIECPY